ncbi:MAG TPA: amino acid permease [Steroidobacteraceae bacterium]|nr:amino acid permease [Steroidobacteraceae bacterium]
MSAADAVGSEHRSLGLGMCVALVVGNIIGVGIFALPASLAPYGLNALTGWLITLVGCTFITITFAVLPRAFPRDDGPYAYAQRAFGDGAAFFVMWCYWVSTWMTNATIAIAVVGYFTVFFPALNTNPWLPPITALSLLWIFVAINLRGARTAGWVQVLTTILKLCPLVGVICLGAWVLFAHPSAYTHNVPPNAASWGEVSSASTLALYAMLGIECATIPACRIKDPQRTIPAATIIGAAVTALIYVGVSLIPMLLIPQKELAASSAPFADLFRRVLGPSSGEILALFIIIGGLGALNGWTLLLGEVTQGLARHGRFPALLARENSHGAPVFAFVITGLVASAVLLSNYDQSISSGFTFMSVVVTATNIPMYFVCGLAITVLAWRGRIPAKPHQAFGWAVAGFCAAAYCAWASVGIGLRPLLYTLGLSAVGIPVYLTFGHLRRRTPVTSAVTD